MRSGRASDGGYWINKTKDFSESLGARPPCGRMFIRIVLSSLWDLSRFVRTSGLELVWIHCFVRALELEFSYGIRFVDPRRQVWCCTVQVKPPYVKTQLWFIDSMLTSTTRGMYDYSRPRARLIDRCHNTTDMYFDFFEIFNCIMLTCTPLLV